MTADGIQVHASCVVIGATGVLLRGPSGSGKSDLALRLIDGGARLVADDRVDLERDPDSGGLLAAAPRALAGLIEVRGLGIVRLPAVARARLGLVVDLCAAAAVPRLPEPRRCAYLGLTLPLLAVAPFETSAAAKLRLAARALNDDIVSEGGL